MPHYVRNFRGGNGDVGITRGPVRAIALPDTAEVIAELNQVVRGWAGYFHFQHCGRAFSVLRRFVSQRVRIYLRRKHQVQSWGYRAFPDA